VWLRRAVSGLLARESFLAALRRSSQRCLRALSAGRRTGEPLRLSDANFRTILCRIYANVLGGGP
jgi:hypothetical protein